MNAARPLSLIGENVLEEMARIAADTPPGCFVEVGVYRGGSAWGLTELARKQARQIFLYETFSGIPYSCELDNHRAGDFSDTSYEEVAFLLPYANVIRGIFPQSAVPMSTVSFAHVDCDQYRSVKESVEYLSPRMQPGGILWFDDYGCLPGATQAVDELYQGKIRTAVCGKSYVIID